MLAWQSNVSVCLTSGISYPGSKTMNEPVIEADKLKAPTGVSCIPLLGGIRVLESSHCQERVWWRKPRTKKRRILRKWKLREENVRYKPLMFKTDANTIICHPSIAAKLRAMAAA